MHAEVAKHKATEGKGGKMGFYFAHDIPEEIKATGDASQSATSAKQQAANGGKTLKQQQQQSSRPLQGLDATQGTQRTQKLGRPLLNPVQTSPDPLQAQHRQLAKQQEQPSIAKPRSEQQSSTLGSDHIQPSSVRGAAAQTKPQPMNPGVQSSFPHGTSSQGSEAGSSRGSVEVHRKLARDLPGTKAPLGYYFEVPEGVKAAKSQLFQGDAAAARAAAGLAGTKGPLGYYFSKDITDSAKRKGSWRARLLRSHLQPDAIHVNPF